MKDCILFFAKYPMPGEVKTRLAEGSFPELAAEFYATFVEDKLEELLAECSSDIIVCFAPEKAGGAMRDWLGSELRYIGQKGTDLGRRMENAFREAFFMGYERVVLVGSDIPALSASILQEALDSLTPEQPCIGPADDGGYYCIGFHKLGFIPDVFKNMEWSTDLVLQQTVSILEDKGMQYHELPPLADTDTIEDVETMVALGTSGPLKPRSLALARKLVGA
ncbi:conserved protein of unknown function [Pseudodesulfovibrio profundus]|uniref:Glycosyltransferase n=1 Tax=Pseudodesulfovibrio profundus TaxID=57320 RepID=A0A2C8FBF7_9BACT|nr:TIGR04282 family arsenosugar biosynthesis glycosyltransferase [Pseudodesulfovibrio profundus]SOB59831.1 conserved protein of unknown function [Pseudodesulfovibrio profundus]